MHDTVRPDVETAGAGYAARFDGEAGRFLLDGQERCVLGLLPDRPLTVLEVGGGHGQLTRPLLERGCRVWVQGSASDAFTRLAPLRGVFPERLRFVTCGLWRLPFADAAFDVVIGVRLLAHVRDWQGLLGEMTRVCGGRLIVDFPVAQGPEATGGWAFRLKRRVEGNTRPYFRYREADLVRHLAGCGFGDAQVTRQFLLPMAAHRLINRRAVSEVLEVWCRSAGLTRRWGGPAVLAADRTVFLPLPQAGEGRGEDGPPSPSGYACPALSRRRERGFHGRALVIGDDDRSFLSIVRSLGRRGGAVDACPFDFSSPALASRYLQKVHRLPPYALSADDWVAALGGILAGGGYDLVIPCDDRAIIPLMRHRLTLPQVRLALPNEAAFAVFYDKAATREAAAAAGVPVAPGRLLDDGDTAAGLAVELGLPLVLKPRRSFDLDNPTLRRAVSVCRDLASLETALAELRQRDAVLVEGFFAGSGVGVSILAQDGRVLQAVQHRRVAEQPGNGGSSYRVSEAADARLMGCAARLAEATALCGVAMFEFRQNAQGGFVLLEVNARFWGSLPLAVAAGVDFPWLLYRLLVDGVAEPPRPARAGIYARNVTADVWRIAADVAAARRCSTAAMLRCLVGNAWPWLRLLGGRERHDAWAADDPGPGWRDYGALARSLAGAVGKRLPVAAPLRRLAAERALRHLARPATVLVLCQGNIYRSPFAAALLRRVVDVTVVSAGLLPFPGRAAPEPAQRAAWDFGVDLAAHRSCYASDALLSEADLIVVFDEVNEQALRRRGLRIKGPVVRLGDLSGGGGIVDPYGLDEAGVALTYRRIQQAVQRLAVLLGAKR